ncbi:MAG: DHA2 family efflux MFS transporter permease subunit [Gammaproteobacteria bacterium]|nr:DHA2 family efflux MFS transporter permease subunit [Gammaproteobacteria bacterium]
MITSGTASQTAARGANPVLVSITVMLATVMVILDMTVVNVNLDEMMGALGANADQITWVLTSYIVAEAVTIPLGGVLALRLGRKRLMSVCVTGFIITSALCGQAASLTEMVVFRVLQGAFAASIVPVSQSIMIDTFAPEARGRAMAVWGIGIMLGPILGPTLGGYISQHLSWRWVFYINVPVGLLNLVLIAIVLEQTRRENARADWFGAVLLMAGVGALQALLDQGNQRNWFASPLIQGLALVSVVSLTAFVWRSLGRDDAVLRLALLRDRNLRTASLMMMAFGLGMFGTIALQPIMLSQLFGYPTQTVGLVMAPRGLAAALGMFLVAVSANRIEPRYMVGVGLMLAAMGSYMMGWLNLQADAFWFVLPSLVQGMGMGMIFVPLSTLAFASLPPAQTDFGSGLFNLSRTVGSSIGISAASTLLTHSIAVARSGLVTSLTPSNPNLSLWLDRVGPGPSATHAMATLERMLETQSAMLGFIHTFVLIAFSFVLLAPLLLLFRPSGRRGGDAMASPVQAG